MHPKQHSWFLFLSNLFMYILIFVVIIISYTNAYLSKEYVMALFIFSLLSISFINVALKRFILAKCPECGSRCRISGRKPMHYHCFLCEFSQKSNLFEGSQQNTAYRD